MPRTGSSCFGILSCVMSLMVTTRAEPIGVNPEEPRLIVTVIAALCIAWYVIIWSICLLGFSIARQLAKSHKPRSPLSPPRPSLIVSTRGTSPSSSVDSALRLGQDSFDSSAVPGVSILRPLSGLDCNLYSNLASSFNQDYPPDRFEVILSIAESSSQEAQRVLNIAEMVHKAHPHVDCRIVVGDENAGVNPKINNLIRPYSLAKYDILWVVDSQVWAPTGAMARAVDDLTTNQQVSPVPRILRRKPHGTRVGLVHHVPFAVLPGSSWGSKIERVFLSTTHAKMYLAINSLSIDSCVMGKSNMYRKSDLAQVPDSFFDVGTEGSRGERGAIGSFAFSSQTTPPSAPNVFANAVPQDVSKDRLKQLSRPLARFGIYLAEDNMLAQSLWNAPLNLSHTLSSYDLAYTSVGDIRTLRDYTRRRMRWIRVRKYMVLAPTLLEPLTESVLSGLVAWYGISRLLLPSYLASTWMAMILFYLAHWISWFWLDYTIFHYLSGSHEHAQACNPGSLSAEHFGLLEFLAAWMLREALALPIWVWAICGSTVSWRNRTYRILSSGRAGQISRSRRAHMDFDPLLESAEH